MATAPSFEIETGNAPRDETPVVSSESVTGDFDPDYPGSTSDAPYGFKDDGTPYRRRPRGTANKASKSTGTRRSPASESQARTAAALLAKANNLMAISLMALGMPLTAMQLRQANEDFESMAYEALLTDPALCRKILSAGATSGKTALLLAYGMLGFSVVPSAMGELKERRAKAEMESDND
jgi:hypothetical protein